ncbi:MAG TPA: hypothetical protein VHA74_03050 [Candidatus Dojkabacteria bacterium]|nr:hypothetical protein [Candidatus Dojkabacteria bacterium]
METFKNVLRYLFVAIFSFVVFALVLVCPLIFSLYTTVIDSQNVITILRQSDAYSTIPKYIFDQAAQDQKTQSNGGKTSDADIDPKVIRKLLDQKDIQGHIQQITEDAITQFYAQMKDKKSNITIQANVLKIKTLAFTALIQIESLKGKNVSAGELIKCTVISRINKNTGCTQDIVEINRGFDTQLKQLDKNYKPGDKTFNIINIQQPLLPVLYTNILLVPFILIFMVLFFIVLNIILFKNKTKGLLETGIDILVAGLLNFVLWFSLHNNIEALLKSMNFNETFMPLAANTLKIVFTKHIFFTYWTMIIASTVIVISIVILIIVNNRHAQKPQ